MLRDIPCMLMQSHIRAMLILLSLISVLPLGAVAQDFCNVQGRFVEELGNAIDQNNKEVSGLTLNVARTYFFTISDSPKGDPLIFVTENTQSPRSTATIKITGVANTGFNGGYGDWESIVSYKCSTNPGRHCLLVGDIGHNKVRNKGGALRTDSQSVRFIEVEEPSASELSSGQVLEKPGKAYDFSYPGSHRFDAEAMVVKDDRLFVITKNSASYKYSHMFEVPKLETGVELISRAIFHVRYSEVTGAASSPGYLILRTYIGLNFYKWDALCDNSVRESKVYQTIEFLERGHGLQEAIEYDASTQYLYLLGEGSSTLNRMQCVPAASPTRSPALGALCLDNYDGKATGLSASFGCQLNLCPICRLILVVMAWWLC